MQSWGGGTLEHMFQALHVLYSGTILGVLVVQDHYVLDNLKEMISVCPIATPHVSALQSNLKSLSLHVQ